MRRRSGFTLLELVVGLSVAATALLVVRATVEGIQATAEHIRSSALELQADADFDIELRELIENVEVRAPDRLFSGDSLTMGFQSWCRAPGGWTELCSVRVSAEPAGGSRMLTLSRGRSSTKHLVRADGIVLRYLDSPARGGRWLARWENRIQPPIAILLLLGRDSVLLPVGVRG